MSIKQHGVMKKKKKKNIPVCTKWLHGSFRVKFLSETDNCDSGHFLLCYLFVSGKFRNEMSSEWLFIWYKLNHIYHLWAK